MSLGSRLLLSPAALLIAGCGATTPPPPASTSVPAQLGRPITAIGATRPPRSAQSRLSLPPLKESEPTASARAVDRARPAARGFFATYLDFLYARLPATKVTDVDRQLRSQLDGGEAVITPAEHTAKPRILHLSISPAGPPLSAIATATVLANGRRYQLTATLEPRGGSWIAVAVDG